MNFDKLREAIASDNLSKARLALTSLVHASAEEAEPLLLLGLEQSDMFMRQLSFGPGTQAHGGGLGASRANPEARP